MKYLLPFLILPLALALVACAQGVSAPWDISQTLTSLAAQSQRLVPILDQLTPDKWEAKGAPAAFTAQWRNALKRAEPGRPGRFGDGSDIDLLVRMSPGRSVFDIGGLLMDLQDLLGRRVDVVTERGLRPRIREQVLREAVPI